MSETRTAVYHYADVMRTTPTRDLTPDEMRDIATVKAMGQGFWNGMDGLGTSRELSLAKTKIEEAVMWAVKHITR